MGKIVAIGGGENGRPGTEYETGAFDKEIVLLTGKKQPNFLFIGLANKFSDSYFDIMDGIYGEKYGCKTAHLTESDIKNSEIACSKIKDADIIYVGGGNTLRLMNLLRKYGIDQMLKKAYKENKVLCGVSAGAICWCDFGNSDSRKFTSGSDQLLKVKGLGLVHVLLCPHFNVEPKRPKDLPRMMKTTCKIPAVALDNGAALEIVDDKFRIINSIEGATARKFYWKKRVYHTEIIERNVYYDIDLIYELK